MVRNFYTWTELTHRDCKAALKGKMQTCPLSGIHLPCAVSEKSHPPAGLA